MAIATKKRSSKSSKSNQARCIGKPAGVIQQRVEAQSSHLPRPTSLPKNQTQGKTRNNGVARRPKPPRVLLNLMPMRSAPRHLRMFVEDGASTPTWVADLIVNDLQLQSGLARVFLSVSGGVRCARPPAIFFNAVGVGKLVAKGTARRLVRDRKAVANCASD
ncbi:hypothetical protein CA85_11390 [Allorhodopirellula solitaria]|uniref:Uncharacterized protein n=1 Tax=Allorhodopirellula solitaria TaxID=2527987 RepID=A0A5C5YI41_9BACT|nr:hypothetical protein CA85_11390 [Allorhodopirellula solitaria]